MKYPTNPLTAIGILLLASCGRREQPASSPGSAATTPDTTAATAPVAVAPTPATPTPTTTPAPAPTPSTTEDTAAPPPLRDAYHTAPLDTVDAKTYQGWKYFNLNCARCHGEDAAGTMLAPHLILSLKPDGTIPNEGIFLQVVCGGRPEKGMPAWCTLGLSTAQIDTIYAYVKGRSDAKIHPGRPAHR